jgi:hemerythrin-like domain-containing protein
MTLLKLLSKMKRHPALISLSHDHHHGLLLAQLIKKDAPEYKGLPKDLNGKINYTIDIYNSSLKKHFDNEENILFPFLRGKDEFLDNLILEIINEHRLLENLIAKLYNSLDQINLLDKIGNILGEHIRKEERILFEKSQTVLTEDELIIIGVKLNSSSINENESCGN